MHEGEGLKAISGQISARLWAVELSAVVQSAPLARYNWYQKGGRTPKDVRFITNFLKPHSGWLAYEVEMDDRGACMPALAWTEFLDVYYRPHLLVVNLGTSTDTEASKQMLGLLRQLIESLQSTADYAFLPEENEVKIAFERDIDFEVARGLL